MHLLAGLENQASADHLPSYCSLKDSDRMEVFQGFQCCFLRRLGLDFCDDSQATAFSCCSDLADSSKIVSIESILDSTSTRDF